VKTLFLLPVATAVCLLVNTSLAQTSFGYTSPIVDYQKFSDEKVLPWKAANDKVGEIGGWRAYTKEAQAVEALPKESFSATKSTVLDAESAAKLALPIRLAWLQAVGKQEQASYASQMQTSAQASSELARRMRSVGNFTRLQQANQHALYAETATLVLTTSQEAVDAREQLIRAMGLNDAKAVKLTLPNRLSDLPTSPMDESILRRVIRVDNNQQFAPEEPSELRSSYIAYRNAYALAKHYQDEVLPLRKIIAEEATLRYNGMFIGVFELLAEQREQTKMVMASIAAKQAFWQAETAFHDTLLLQSRPLPLTGD
jgi:outer membrane protein TolC